MSLHHLVYFSRAVGPVTDNVLSDIHRHAVRANRSRGIAGLLVYGGGRYMQLLEGPLSEIRSRFARIAADPRHTAVEELFCGPAPDRLFETSNMGLFNLDNGSEDGRGTLRELARHISSTADTDTRYRAVIALFEALRACTPASVASGR